MADNTKNEVNGIRFQLLNIEDVDPKDYVPHELFAKGENDLVMIDSNCKPFPFLDFIIKKLNQKVGLNHLNTSEAHAIVDSKTSGFMSSALYDLLNKNTNTISELAYEIGVNRSMNPYSIDLLEYILDGNTITIKNAIISNGAWIARLYNHAIMLKERPKKEFINKDNKSGYRDDLILIKMLDGKNGELLYISDCIYTEDIIYFGNTTLRYNSNFHYYKANDDTIIYIPLLKIRMRNNELISINNINGYLTESINKFEVEDISRHKIATSKLNDLLEDIIKEYKENGNMYSNSQMIKILSTRKEREDVKNNVLLYLPLNGNDIEQKTEQRLNKEMRYRTSPFGKMMRNALKSGDIISFDQQNKFILEFLFCNENVTTESVIRLFNQNLKCISELTIDKKVITININNQSIYNLDMSNFEKFSFVKLYYDTSGQLIVYVNNKILCDKIIEPFEAIKKIQIPALSTEIGEIVIGTPLYQNSINDNNILIPNDTFISTENHIYKNSSTFDIYTVNDELNVVMDMKNTGLIQPGDIMNVYFNNEIIDSYEEKYSIVNIIGNKILTTDNSAFKIGDVILIGNIDTRYNETYNIINKDKDFIYLDKVISKSAIGYNIFNINDSLGVIIKDNKGKQLTNIIKDRFSASVVFTEEYDVRTRFTIEYFYKKDKENIINKIDDIESVYMNGEVLKSISHGGYYKKSDMTVYYNDEYITPLITKDQEKYDVFRSEDINLSISIFLSDFMNCSAVPLEEITKIFDIKFITHVGTTKGGAIRINNKEIKTEPNIVIPYSIDIEPTPDHVYKFKINVTNENPNNNTLILGDTIFMIEFKENISQKFFKPVESGPINDYICLNKNKSLFVSNTDNLDIICNYKEDNYVNISDYEVLVTNGDYKLIKGSNNLIMFTINNKFYYLDKYYIV